LQQYEDLFGERPPGYASGGLFSGGLRIVGEQGPELELTGPVAPRVGAWIET